MAATVILGSSEGASLKPPRFCLEEGSCSSSVDPSRGCSRAHSTHVQKEGGQKPAVNKRHLANKGAVPDTPGKGECLGTQSYKSAQSD